MREFSYLNKLNIKIFFSRFCFYNFRVQLFILQIRYIKIYNYLASHTIYYYHWIVKILRSSFLSFNLINWNDYYIFSFISLTFILSRILITTLILMHLIIIHRIIEFLKFLLKIFLICTLIKRLLFLSLTILILEIFIVIRLWRLIKLSLINNKAYLLKRWSLNDWIC